MQINALNNDKLIVQNVPEKPISPMVCLALTCQILTTIQELLNTSSTQPSEEFLSISTRHKEIFETREHFRRLVESLQSDPLYQDLASWALSTSAAGTYQFTPLVPVDQGISGTYFLTDEKTGALFVIKPFDEEAGCINNPKFWAGTSTWNPIRDDIPLYHSAMREVLAYQIALSIGVASIAPPTILAIIQSDQFHDYADHLSPLILERYLEQCGPADREKLCSVQQYVPDSQPLWEAIYNLEQLNLSDAEIAARFDQTDFEDANLLIWTTYDTDGHLGNLLAYPKSTDAAGNTIFGIKKIDNGLSFPDQNRQLRNNLSQLENAKQPLSDAAKEKIAAIDIEKLVEQCKIYGLESAIPALRERVAFLQRLVANQPGITIKDINTAMTRIGRDR